MNVGAVGTGEFVVASGEAPVFLELTDLTFDDVALAVGAPVHQARPDLGCQRRDDRSDAAAAEVVAGRPAGVAAVRQKRSRSTAWPTWAGTLYGPGGHQRRERRLLVALARGQDEGERPPTALATQVQLAAEAAARAAERVIRLPPLAPAA